MKKKNVVKREVREKKTHERSAVRIITKKKPAVKTVDLVKPVDKNLPENDKGQKKQNKRPKQPVEQHPQPVVVNAQPIVENNEQNI